MAKENAGGSVILLPCNGLSARGQVTEMASAKIREAMEEVRRVDLVPLLAGLTDEQSAVNEARAVIGLAGCSYRCEARACRQAVGRELDDGLVVGDLMREDVTELSDATEQEIEQCVLEVTSRVLAVLSQY